jgi:predicted RND superfamily exporter protein
MLYTSLISAAGFASLALTPIPPVQVFGIFVAVGIMIAWIFTVTFVPAYVMLISEKSLENFGRKAVHEEKQSWLTKILRRAGLFTYAKAKLILAIMAVIMVAAVYGITKININDNPVKWFSKSHPIRQADRVLNSHFGGTYMAYLVIESGEADGGNITEYIHLVRSGLLDMAVELEPKFPNALEVVDKMDRQLRAEDLRFETKAKFIEKMTEIVDENTAKAEDKELDLWYEISTFCEMEAEKLKIFKQPEVLKYISKLQGHLQDTGLIGKSTSVADIVKKVHQELTDGQKENYKIPDSQRIIGECLFQFQGGHKPWYLWHFISYDYMHSNIWLQLTSGDNRDMQKVVKNVDEFFAENKPPIPLKYNWAGLTYINVEWQKKMVWGMLQSFLGSFIVVFIMMSILFRSALWGIVCMVPLSLTILMIYGIIGIMGKDYDMPVAVLSALTLGMAVDFAIHFLERARESYKKFGSWKESASVMFGGPARAISRNVLVIAIGFLPLLAAPLVPYKTVGIFLCAIMALSGLVTLLVLPALLKLFEKRLFAPEAEPVSPACNCGLCLIISAVAVILLAINLHQYWQLGFSRLAWISIVTIPLMALICGILSRRRVCKRTEKKESEV